MRIHNQMEEVVADELSEIYNSSTFQEKNICSCNICRLDVICYALNRIKPEYILSSKGLSYFHAGLSNDYQRRIDVIKCLQEGIKVVSSTRPVGHAGEDGNVQITQKLTPPVFNFPIISGRFLDGASFAPLSDGIVTIRNENGQPSKMISKSWRNPYWIVRSTGGRFTFWPSPAQTKSVGERRSFTFNLDFEQENEPMQSSSFVIELESQDAINTSIYNSITYELSDKFVFNDDDDE